MNDEQGFASVFSIAEEFSSIEAFAAASSEVYSGSHRMDGEYYGDDGYRARQAVVRSRFPTKALHDLVDVYWPGTDGSYSEYKRIYVDDKAYGVPFLSTSQMLLARFDDVKYVTRMLTGSMANLIVHAGQILLSVSGTIGNTVITNRDFDGLCVSNDAMRLNPREPEGLGLLFCFLQSQAGRFLLTRNKAGGVVEHLYVDDVSSLPVPVLPKRLCMELTELVAKSNELRARGNQLIDEAIADVQHQCYLPDMNHFMPGRTSNAEPLTFIHSAKSRLFPENAGFGERRLDATYHEPAAVALAKYIFSHDRGCELGDVLAAVRNSTLRKRNYVDDPELGVALIGGKQLMQWRPQGVKYLSKALTRNLGNETVEDGWTLVSCGGTLGRTMFVHRNFDGCAPSQHVMRLVPDTASVFGGFIYAFLASPYGQVQIAQRSYGSVIQEIRDFQFKSIAISLPDDRGELIHEKIVRAFDARADAHDIEDRALNLFETAIERGKTYTEAEWGSEY
ncbi:hypothetical protein [Gimesia sp.]|uniref:hypothetical protein n=1 Tax=Gimesia sp. TaxID=2024833 RepID=UPI003A941C15